VCGACSSGRGKAADPGGWLQEVKGRKRHIVTDTGGLAGRCRGAPADCPRSRWCRAGHRGDPPAVSLACATCSPTASTRPQTCREALSPDSASGPSRLSTLPLTQRGFSTAATAMGRRTNPSLGLNRKPPFWPRISSPSIASAKAWGYIASVQLARKEINWNQNTLNREYDTTLYD